MRLSFRVWCLGWLTFLILPSPVTARPWIYEPDRSGELRRMREEFHDLYESKGRFQELRDAYLQYARDHEGTSNGGDALLGAANITVIYLADLPGARVLFQEAIDKYPGSTIEAGARSNLAGWERRADGETVYLAKISQISVDFGGPSMEEVLAATDTSALAAQVRQLHPEVQLGLFHVYKSIFYGLKKIDFDQAFAIAEFGRSALEPAALPGRDDYSGLVTDLISERYNPPGNITSIPSTPQVTILSPLPNSTVGPNPTLQLRATTGNYHMTRVDLTRLEFEVDGVDRRFEVVVKNDLDLSFQENVNFETLTLSLPTDLGPGVHTATVKVRRAKIAADQELPQPVEVTWSFTVDPNHSSQPTTETLPATKDAIIDNFDPNGNEGANGILALDKLLGRSSRSLVAFDLSDVDTDRLTKATLVLSIHKKEKIFGCGQGENVSVQALTHPWVEGNGKTYKVFPAHPPAPRQWLRRDLEPRYRYEHRQPGSQWRDRLERRTVGHHAAHGASSDSPRSYGRNLTVRCYR